MKQKKPATCTTTTAAYAGKANHEIVPTEFSQLRIIPKNGMAESRPARAVRWNVTGLSRYRKSGTNATNARKVRPIGGKDSARHIPESTGKRSSVCQPWLCDSGVSVVDCAIGLEVTSLNIFDTVKGTL